MKSNVPQAVITLDCPILKKPCEVNFEVNVFRGANHGGVEVTRCSEFTQTHGVPMCAQGCTHMPEAKNIHEQEIAKHREALSLIGSNVIG